MQALKISLFGQYDLEGLLKVQIKTFNFYNKENYHISQELNAHKFLVRRKTIEEGDPTSRVTLRTVTLPPCKKILNLSIICHFEGTRGQSAPLT